MGNTQTRDLLGIRVGSHQLEDLLDEAVHCIAERNSTFTFACANPHSMVVSQSDRAFRAALKACSAVVADGVGVTLAGRFVGSDVGPRITGHDFFLGLMRRLNQRGGRVFFLGSSDEVLARIQNRARRDYPNLAIHALSPPFGEWSDIENDEIVSRIKEAKADILWVGMTAPKQEKWVHANAARCGVSVIGSIGAVFDFYAETVQRAPRLVRALGMEWLYRLVREPRRLWRRTLISAPAFFWHVLRRHIFRSVS